MKRPSIHLDEDLIREAKEILGVDSNSRAVHNALEEFVCQHHRKQQLKSGLGNLDIELTPDEMNGLE